jgi:hypothetical protein
MTTPDEYLKLQIILWSTTFQAAGGWEISDNANLALLFCALHKLETGQF